MKIEHLPVESIEMNMGQIDGLPANPRAWTRDDITKIAKSLKETPELFEMRPLIVKAQEGRYVVLGGNLRFCGARENGDEKVPCVVIPETMPVAKMKEIVIKDNASFGAWDLDALKGDWGDLPLGDWGLPEWTLDNPDEPLPGFLEGDGPEPGVKDEKITIKIPPQWRDKTEDIKASLRLTLEEWEGCEVE